MPWLVFLFSVVAVVVMAPWSKLRRQLQYYFLFRDVSKKFENRARWARGEGFLTRFEKNKRIKKCSQRVPSAKKNGSNQKRKEEMFTCHLPSSHVLYTYKFGIVLFIKSNGNLQFEQKTTVRTSGKKEFNCCWWKEFNNIIKTSA